MVNEWQYNLKENGKMVVNLMIDNHMIILKYFILKI
jgi:hypothetical protein